MTHDVIFFIVGICIGSALGYYFGAKVVAAAKNAEVQVKKNI